MCVRESQVVLQGLAADAEFHITRRSVSHGLQIGDDAGHGEVVVGGAVAVQDVRPAFLTPRVLDLGLASRIGIHDARDGATQRIAAEKFVFPRAEERQEVLEGPASHGNDRDVVGFDGTANALEKTGNEQLFRDPFHEDDEPSRTACWIWWHPYTVRR